MNNNSFKVCHNTETTLVRVTNDLILTADRKDCSILELLDLRAAFDTVNHNILTIRN